MLFGLSTGRIKLHWRFHLFTYRWRENGATCSLMWQEVANFDYCGFGKYWFISLRLTLLMPLKPAHNLLVRGSNPCRGTNQRVSS